MARKSKEELEKEYIAKEEAELEKLRENARRLQQEEDEQRRKKDLLKKVILFKFVIPGLILAGIVIYIMGCFRSCSKKPIKEPAEVLEEVGTAVEEAAEAIVEEVIIGEEGEYRYITESTLSEVVSTAVLYTASYPYNGFVGIKDAGGTVKYYVAYKGNVKAGFDFDKVEVSLDEDTDTITVILPELNPLEITVDNDLDYLFMDDKMNTEGIFSQAYTAAEEDLKNRMRDDAAIKKAAVESAKTAELALLKPWVEQVDPDRDYTINVMYAGEAEQ